VRWPELYRSCLAAALLAAGPVGCRERERWPRSERVRPEPARRAPECESHELCMPVVGACPSAVAIPAATGRAAASAAFDAERTDQRRGRFPYQASSAQACCYSWQDACRGRPLFTAGGGVAWALPAERDDWLAEAEGLAAIEQADAGLRAELARHWGRAAADEHASIAAFARAALDLLALGAPAELVAAHHQAALEEIAHARLAYTLAARAAGAPIGPGPLPEALGWGARSRLALARDVYLGGCVAETIAAAVADVAARGACSALAGPLAALADDERSHAALAWRTVAWLVSSAGSERRAVAQAIAAAATGVRQRAWRGARPERAWADGEAFGLLAPRRIRAIHEEARRGIVLACTRRLLRAA
jgi:hypothetical protein